MIDILKNKNNFQQISNLPKRDFWPKLKILLIMTNTYVVTRKMFLTRLPNCLRRRILIKVSYESSFITLSHSIFCLLPDRIICFPALRSHAIPYMAMQLPCYPCMAMYEPCIELFVRKVLKKSKAEQNIAATRVVHRLREKLRCEKLERLKQIERSLPPCREATPQKL